MVADDEYGLDAAVETDEDDPSPQTARRPVGDTAQAKLPAPGTP
jgi:hypothetical protein